jgi:hypothetical protein
MKHKEHVQCPNCWGYQVYEQDTNLMESENNNN